MSRCLEIDSVMKSFGKETDILTDIFLRCQPKDIIGLFGRNGSGKTTLFKIIFGSMKGERSFIRINDQVQSQPCYLSGMVAYLPQDNFLPQHLIVEKVAEIFLRQKKKDVNNFLADRYLFGLRKEKVKNLSGGELRYLEIKLLLFGNAEYLLLDEPFNGLSPVAAEEIRKYIRIASQSKGIILSDHNYREVSKIANRIFLLDQGYLKELSQFEDLTSHGYII